MGSTYFFNSFFSLPNFISSVGAHEPWVMASWFLSSAWRVLKRFSLPKLDYQNSMTVKKGRR